MPIFLLSVIFFFFLGGDDDTLVALRCKVALHAAKVAKGLKSLHYFFPLCLHQFLFFFQFIKCVLVRCWVAKRSFCPKYQKKKKSEIMHLQGGKTPVFVGCLNRCLQSKERK